MKKFISLALTLALLLVSLTALTACGGNVKDKEVVEQMRRINVMLENAIPTQTVTVTTQKIGAMTLGSTATLTVGSVGGAKATTYVNEYDQLASIDARNTSAALINKKVDRKWYVEGLGVSENYGDWDEEGENFAPKPGDVKIALSANNVETATFDKESGVLTATVNKDNANSLLKKYLLSDQKISSDVTITIASAGGRVINLKLEYVEPSHDITLPAPEEGGTGETVTIPEAEITVDINFVYDNVKVTLD